MADPVDNRRIKLCPVESRAILEADRAQKLLMELRARMEQEINKLKEQWSALRLKILEEEKNISNMIDAGNKSYQETLSCIIEDNQIKSPWTAKIIYDESNVFPIAIEVSHTPEKISELASPAK